MTIKLSPEVEKQLITSIKLYFAEFMEDEIGDLKASLFLSYCVQEIGPCIYNQAIADAQAYLQDKVLDLESSCYEPEFTYWRK